MNHDRRRLAFPVVQRWLVCAQLAVASSACGFGGQLELGDNGGNAGVSALLGSGGASASGGATAALGGAGSAGAQSSVGGASSSTEPGGAPNGKSSALVMDATGVVPLSSNDFGIDGKWYAYSDELEGGQTRISGYHEFIVPFVAGSGMCISGTTQSGFVDNFKTWGAGIGIALNVTNGTPLPLVNPPACFTVVISASAQYPTDLRADLFGDADAEGQPVNVPLQPGSNEVCWREAREFAYCSDDLKCQTPDSLNVGLSKINVTAPSGSVPGPISFCIESITPHN